MQMWNIPALQPAALPLQRCETDVGTTRTVRAGKRILLCPHVAHSPLLLPGVWQEVRLASPRPHPWPGVVAMLIHPSTGIMKPQFSRVSKQSADGQKQLPYPFRAEKINRPKLEVSNVFSQCYS